MFIKIIIALSLGILFGIITGLIPGIHINLISSLILLLSPFFLKIIKVEFIAIFIISMSITHTFLDSIPSIFLGAPDESNCLIVLPGHKKLLEGKGKEAIVMTLIGSLGALVFCTSLSPLLTHITKLIYPIIKDKIYILIIIAISFLILTSKNKLSSIFIFIISGYLGFVSLNSLSKGNVLFPLLTGFFGLSNLLLSLKDNNEIPKQIKSNKYEIKKILQPILLSTIFGYIASFLPGLGSSHAAIYATKFMKEKSTDSFLILSGGINTVNMNLSLITFYLFTKARNGSITTIIKLMESLTINNFILFFIITIISGSIAFLIGLNITEKISKIITKINYTKLTLTIILLIIILTPILSGIKGIMILIISTSIGILASQKEVAKNNCLGCLIIPTIINLI